MLTLVDGEKKQNRPIPFLTCVVAAQWIAVVLQSARQIHLIIKQRIKTILRYFKCQNVNIPNICKNPVHQEGILRETGKLVSW